MRQSGRCRFGKPTSVGILPCLLSGTTSGFGLAHDDYIDCLVLRRVVSTALPTPHTHPCLPGARFSEYTLSHVRQAGEIGVYMTYLTAGSRDVLLYIDLQTRSVEGISPLP